jgi:hypothetical protein
VSNGDFCSHYSVVVDKKLLLWWIMNSVFVSGHMSYDFNKKISVRTFCRHTYEISTKEYSGIAFEIIPFLF